MKREVIRLFAYVLVPVMAVFNLPCSLLATTEKVVMEITHTPLVTVPAGQRIEIGAEIVDDAGVDEVRVYFKIPEVADYSFVSLKTDNGIMFTGMLPAPAQESKHFTYLILAVNGQQQVVRSQVFEVAVEADSNSVGQRPGRTMMTVYSELQRPPATVAGFADNLVVNGIDSATKYGTFAGLYSISTAGSFTGTAVPGGTVMASTEGLSTLVIAGSVIGAGIVIGAVAAGGSGSDGDGDNEEDTVVPCPFTGNWQGSYIKKSCDGTTSNGFWKGTVDDECSFSGFDSAGTLSGKIKPETGAVELTGKDDACGEISGTAQFDGNQVSGTWSGSELSAEFIGSR
ncbi:MAG: hypothetical protein CSA26_06470 [Desulfobacterales bacterium]|nr:MAG: hypothetical protein CSA26_06470 [Desulfobacterales bacterium]